jgi:flagellar motor switch protein FliN/FliY
MAENIKQEDVDALLAQMQAGNSAMAADTAAVQEVAKAADQIAAEAQAATAPAGDPIPAPPAAESIPAPVAGDAPPLDEPPLGDPVPMPAFCPEVQKLLAIEVPVIVQLGVRRMSVGEVMRFAVGAIIEFQKAADEELELLANNRPIGKGHAVKVGENFGIKVTAVGPMKETIRKLGAA